MQPTIAAVLKAGRQKLKKFKISATGEAEILLTKTLNKNKVFLYTHPEKKLTARQIAIYQKLLKKRIQGQPVAYLLGEREFYGLKFKVNKNVLIPRPETEILVEQAVIAAKNLTAKFPNSPISILDVGTGSGCIIISLAQTLSSRPYHLRASDLSSAAKNLAQQNAKKLSKVKINFYQGDLLRPYPAKIFRQPTVLVANLPYLTKINTGIKFEPRQALLGGGQQGLKIYQRLLEQVAKLELHGFIFLEIDPNQTSAIKKLAKNLLTNSSSQIIKDLSGRSRIIAINL